VTGTVMASWTGFGHFFFYPFAGVCPGAST